MLTDRSELSRALRAPSLGMKGLAALKTRYRPLVCPLWAVLDQIPEGASIYDIGCGSGSLLYLALQLRKARSAVGHDISEDAVSSAQAFISVEPRMSVTCLDKGEFPHLGGYDIITLVDVLHHIPPSEQAAFLTRVTTEMDHGAKLVVLDIDAGKPVRRMANQLHDLLLAKEWVHPLSSAKAAELLDATGLDVSRPKLFDTLWYGHYLITAVKD